MKKLVSLVLIAVMAFSALPASAKSPSLDFLKVTYADVPNIEQSGKITYQLNEPLLCLEQVEEMLNKDDLLDSFDIKGLAEGIFGSETTFTSKIKAENKGEKIAAEIHMKSGFPVVINKNLSFEANTNMSVWLDMDMGENSGINYIMSMPTGSKYLLMNTEDMAAVTGDESINEAFDTVKNMLTPEEMEKLNEKAIELISRNAAVTGNSRNVKITFTDIGFKKYIGDVFNLAFEMVGENPFDEIGSEYKDLLTNVLMKVPFFADEAVVIEYTLDTRGRITEQKEQINVDLNIYDLVAAFGGDASGLVRESSNVSFTVFLDSAVKYNNVTITKPEITDENSVDISQTMAPAEEEYIDYEDYEFFYRWPSVEVDYMFMNSGDAYYIPLRNTLEAFGYEVGYENGVITARTDAKLTEYSSIEFVTGSTTVTTSSGEFEMGSAPVNIDGKTYIRMFDAELLLNSQANSFTNLFGSYQYVDFYRHTQFPEEQ